MIVVGGRQNRSRRVKHTNRHRRGRKGMRGGDNFGANAGLWSAAPPSAAGFIAPYQVSHMPSDSSLLEGMNPNQHGGSSGGHRCSMRHTRTKRTRKAHAGRRSRKHKSRGKKFRMSLKGIFGKS